MSARKSQVKRPIHIDVKLDEEEVKVQHKRRRDNYWLLDPKVKSAKAHVDLGADSENEADELHNYKALRR
jgi:hypothetical protein